jgi:hypothetical protein
MIETNDFDLIRDYRTKLELPSFIHEVDGRDLMLRWVVRDTGSSECDTKSSHSWRLLGLADDSGAIHNDISEAGRSEPLSLQQLGLILHAGENNGRPQLPRWLVERTADAKWMRRAIMHKWHEAERRCNDKAAALPDVKQLPYVKPSRNMLISNS